MIPIIWRYLLAHYLKVLLFCTVAFIALLLTLRLEEIAHFATLGPQGIYILYFTFYQIPYILPIALPISALISSMILVGYLCKNNEMTA
jgi:lipopolysaccharide export system permease protein